MIGPSRAETGDDAMAMTQAMKTAKTHIAEPEKLTLPGPPPDSVAGKIKAARDKAGLTQGQAAARMPGNVAVQYWSDVERARRTPSLEWLWNAAKAIGCDPHALDERLQANARAKRKRSR
jgi:DNA-binding transcriptional regulator YiaG